MVSWRELRSLSGVTGTSVHGAACKLQRLLCVEAWGEGGIGAVRRRRVCSQAGGEARVGAQRCYAQYVGSALRRRGCGAVDELRLVHG